MSEPYERKPDLKHLLDAFIEQIGPGDPGMAIALRQLWKQVEAQERRIAELEKMIDRMGRRS